MFFLYFGPPHYKDSTHIEEVTWAYVKPRPYHIELKCVDPILWSGKVPKSPVQAKGHIKAQMGGGSQVDNTSFMYPFVNIKK